MTAPTYRFALKDLDSMRPDADYPVVFTWNSELQTYGVTIAGQSVGPDYTEYLISAAKLPTRHEVGNAGVNIAAKSSVQVE